MFLCETINRAWWSSLFFYDLKCVSVLRLFPTSPAINKYLAKSPPPPPPPPLINVGKIRPSAYSTPNFQIQPPPPPQTRD